MALANPLSSDMDVLRPSLLPGLIHSLRHNVSRKNYDVALFEIGRVFTSVADAARSESDSGQAVRTWKNAAWPSPSPASARLTFWSGDERDAKFDAYDLKGLVEEFLEQFGLRGVTFSAPRRKHGAVSGIRRRLRSAANCRSANSASLSPALAKKYDLRDAVFLAELNLDLLLARRNPAKSFKPLPQFPAIRRDVAMLVPEATTHEAVLQTVKQTKPANLEAVELFDVFRGKNVPEGQKSLAYAFTYRPPDKTLTDAEVNAAHEKLIEQFRQHLQAVVREG